MLVSVSRPALIVPLILALTGCGEKATVPLQTGSGTDLRLPAPEKSLIPTVNIAPARGWPAGRKPQAAQGLSVTAFATGLVHPRWLHVLPNGDVLVAETNAPPRPEQRNGIKARLQALAMQRAGAAVPSANRITLLRDTDGDGMADMRSVFLANLNSPFGMAYVDGVFYVANTDSLMRYSYVLGQDRITESGTQLAELPAGPRNHHWTKGLIASADGKTLFVSVGSNSNVGEHGMDAERDRAAVLEVDVATGIRRVFAYGLRNPVGMAWQPESGALWTAVNERDELGDDLVPDYMTAVREGSFYGWPYSYYGQHVDERVRPPRPEMVAVAVIPDYALGAHTASLGLAYARHSSGGVSLPAPFVDGMFVGQHGSWNRRPRSGYKVIFVPFAKGQPRGQPVDVLTGFIDGDGDAMGRPVGVALDARGALLVADDVGNTIWRVSAQTAGPGVASSRASAAPLPDSAAQHRRPSRAALAQHD